MKKLYFVILFLFSQQLFSQYLSSGIGRWRLGVNVGGLCQKADVRHDVYNFGFGATLEYAVYQKQSSFFGFSFRGRFLNGKTTGYNTLTHKGIISNDAINGSIDTTFNYSNSPLYLNNRTKLNEFSLEAMLKWNKLYNNTGLLFYIYLGGGFTNYLVETDQKDATGFQYDYSTLSTSKPSVDEIKNLQDGEFETELQSTDYKTMVFTPAVGIGVGLRITPGLDFALEHKISFPQTDLFDGQAIDNGDPSFIQDYYHYTSLGLIFSIVKFDEPTTYTPPVEPTEPTPIENYTTKTERPTITLIKPTTTNFNSPNCKVELIAKIEHVRNQGDITLYQNGSKVPSYLYFYSKPTFKCKVELKEGTNNFKITAKNEKYTETKTFSLACNNQKTISICHKNNDGTSKNITIKENDWATHAAHGDTKGNCPEKQITICHNIPGQGGKTQTISIAESQWSIHKSHGDYLGECSVKKMIKICHNNEEITIDEKDWAAHAAHGDTKGDCPPPQVNMITICHVPPTGNKRITMTIPENEWVVHEAHGDYKGTCPQAEPTTTICHKNSNGTKTTMTIPEFRWNEHFSHGDSKGKCPEESFIICHKDPATGKKSNISITQSLWATHAAHGDTKGKCPIKEKTITICHNIPGKPGQTQTITIPQSKWNIHKSHGDKMGPCPKPDKYIQICHKYGNTSTNMTIKESEWPQHAAHGDTKGNCPIEEKMITICHLMHDSTILSNTGTITPSKTMVIPASQWPAHQAHGDSKGACKGSGNPSGGGPGNSGGGSSSNKKIKICHINQQTGALEAKTINEKDWAAHAAHGDVKGSCSNIDQTPITICHNRPNKETPITKQIPAYQWPFHAAHGDIKGSCPSNTGEPKITICHYPPGNTSNPQTIKIPQSAWPAHKAHGDTKGGCNNSQFTITICHKNNDGTFKTISIPTSDWSKHKAHGDTKGSCSNDNKINVKPGGIKKGKGKNKSKGVKSGGK